MTARAAGQPIVTSTACPTDIFVSFPSATVISEKKQWDSAVLLYNKGDLTFFEAIEPANNLDYAQEEIKTKETKTISSFEELKQAIDSYFQEHHGEIIRYSDLIDFFRYDPLEIIMACDELEEEGKIGPV